MKKFIWNKKNLYLIAAIAGLIIIMALISYFTDLNDPFSKAVKKFYPAAFVGGEMVSVYDWNEFQNYARKLDPSQDQSTVEMALLTNAKERRLAGQLGIKLDQAKIDGELRYYTAGKEDFLQEFLDEYFSGDKNSFIEHVVVPGLVESLLKQKYNSDLQRNSQAFAKAQNILTQLKQGTPFEELARTMSDDTLTGQLGGDLGMVSEGQLLPELEQAVQNIASGEVSENVEVSRLGYHILYVAQASTVDEKKTWHVRHILIEASGYEDWLDKQLDGISVWRIK